MSKLVVERMEAIRRTFIAQASAGGGMPAASKGVEREVFIGPAYRKVARAPLAAERQSR